MHTLPPTFRSQLRDQEPWEYANQDFGDQNFGNNVETSTCVEDPNALASFVPFHAQRIPQDSDVCSVDSGSTRADELNTNVQSEAVSTSAHLASPPPYVKNPNTDLEAGNIEMPARARQRIEELLMSHSIVCGVLMIVFVVAICIVVSVTHGPPAGTLAGISRYRMDNRINNTGVQPVSLETTESKVARASVDSFLQEISGLTKATVEFKKRPINESLGSSRLYAPEPVITNMTAIDVQEKTNSSKEHPISLASGTMIRDTPITVGEAEQDWWKHDNEGFESLYPKVRHTCRVKKNGERWETVPCPVNKNTNKFRGWLYGWSKPTTTAQPGKKTEQLEKKTGQQEKTTDQQEKTTRQQEKKTRQQEKKTRLQEKKSRLQEMTTAELQEKTTEQQENNPGQQENNTEQLDKNTEQREKNTEQLDKKSAGENAEMLWGPGPVILDRGVTGS